MKVVKKIVSFIAFLLLVLVVAAIAIPYLYKDKIVDLVKEEANKTLNAKMDFKEVDISLFRSFPDLNVQLEEVTVDGVDAFEGIRLFEGKEVEFEMNVVDAFAAKDNFPIKSVIFNQPNVHLKVLKNGKANWDITKPAATTEESSNFLVKLKQYIVNNGNLSYVDEAMDFQLFLKDLNHTGSGQFSSDEFDLDTRTYIADMTATYEGIDYLDHVKADLDAIIKMNVPDMKFTLKDNQLSLNDLQVNTAGTVDMNDADYVVDLSFQSPQGDFKSLWSLIPGAYTADFANASILGKMGFKGFVKGTYNGDKSIYPAFQIKADVDKGSVKYPDLPVGIADIFTNITVKSPSSDFDKVVVDIPQFKMQVGNNPVEGYFNLTTPMSDPTVKSKVKGIVDLAEFSKAMPIEGIKELRGTIKSDVTINASQSKIEQKQYDQVDMSGQMSIADLFVQQTGTPPITINHLDTDFSPQRIKLESLNAKLGESDIQATGQLDNILAYFSPEKTMEGKFKFTSNYVNANEWISTDTTLVATDSATAVLEKPFDRFHMEVDGFINKMDYDTYQMSNVKVKGMLSPNESIIENFSTKIGESDIQIDGKVENLMDYVFENEVMTGEIDLTSNYLDLNQFMVEETAAVSEETIEVIPVPENIDITLHSDLKKVHYTNFDLTNIKGDVIVKEEVAQMDDINANILGGKVAFTGGYDTRDLSKPKFNLEYDLEKLNINKAFNTFNTFRAIAPIGKFVDGKLTTKLKMNGVLGEDLIPDLASLNLSGFLHTFGATIKDSKIFEQLSDKLQIEALKNVRLQDSKNWIDIKDGYVELEEATHKIGNDMSFKVKGRHHLMQEDMFYLIEAKIPKNQLNKTVVGAAANQGWNLLVKEATKRGVDIENGDFVNLNINLTGSMLKPIFKIVPVGTDGNVSFEDKANEIVKATTDKIVDSVKTTINTTVDSVRTVVEDKVEVVKDSVKTIVKAETDKIVQQGKTEATKMLLDSALIKNVPGLDSFLLKDSSKVKDKVKDVIKDWNPFKKKKGNG